MKRISLSMKGRRAVSGYLFILPFIIGFVVFMLAPLFMSLQMSFSEVTVSKYGYDINPYFGIEDTKYVTTRYELAPDKLEAVLGEMGTDCTFRLNPTTSEVTITNAAGETRTVTDPALAGQIAEVFGLSTNIGLSETPFGPLTETDPDAAAKLIGSAGVTSTSWDLAEGAERVQLRVIPYSSGKAGTEKVYQITTGAKTVTLDTYDATGKWESTVVNEKTLATTLELLGIRNSFFEGTISNATQKLVTVTTYVNGEKTTVVPHKVDMTALATTLSADPTITKLGADTDAALMASMVELLGLDPANTYEMTIAPIASKATVTETIIEGDTYERVVAEDGFFAAVLDILGLDNYVHALTVDPTYNQLLVEEVTKIATHTLAILVVSFVIALLLNQEFKGRALVRAIFFLPVILSSGVLVNLETDNTLMQGMQDMISEQTPFTVTDSMMEILRLTGLGGDLLDVVFDLIGQVYDIVMGSGIQIIVFLSGLQNVPASLYEAADVEGCTKWEAFWMITFPMVSPLLIVNIIYTIIDFFTKMGGDLSDLLDRKLLDLHYDQMSAMSWIYFLVTLAMIGISALIISKVVATDE